MRAFMVLCALVATPLIVGVSQGLPGTSSCVNGKGTVTRSPQGTANAHQGLCAQQDPPPPPQPPPQLPPPPSPTGCVQSQAGSGTASVDGQVFIDADPWPGLAGWCVELNGPVSATAVTDASGNYLFSGLPGGTYTVCETVQAGWHETFPSIVPACAAGLGWTISV